MASALLTPRESRICTEVRSGVLTRSCFSTLAQKPNIMTTKLGCTARTLDEITFSSTRPRTKSRCSRWKCVCQYAFTLLQISSKAALEYLKPSLSNLSTTLRYISVTSSKEKISQDPKIRAPTLPSHSMNRINERPNPTASSTLYSSSPNGT